MQVCLEVEVKLCDTLLPISFTLDCEFASQLLASSTLTRWYAWKPATKLAQINWFGLRSLRDSKLYKINTRLRPKLWSTRRRMLSNCSEMQFMHKLWTSPLAVEKLAVEKHRNVYSHLGRLSPHAQDKALWTSSAKPHSQDLVWFLPWQRGHSAMATENLYKTPRQWLVLAPTSRAELLGRLMDYSIGLRVVVVMAPVGQVYNSVQSCAIYMLGLQNGRTGVKWFVPPAEKKLPWIILYTR